MNNPMDQYILLSVTPAHLKAWRDDNGYTQVDLALALGVIPLTVSRWERGVREIPPFLHLALEALEQRGGEQTTRGKVRKRKQERRLKLMGSIYLRGGIYWVKYYRMANLTARARI